MIRKFQKECESTCEYILPDYLGDVKKLVSTSAKAVPSGQFGNDTEVEYSGIVAYDIVYLDSENKLSAASFSSDYDFSFPVDSDKYIDTYSTPVLSNFTVRLTGPRRMIAKANISSDVYVMESFAPVSSGNAFSEGEGLEKITNTVNIASAIKSEGVEREYAEEAAALEGVSADEIEVITSNAYVRISESVPVEGGVNIKGELVVTAIIRTPDTSVFAIRREIPFDETVSIDGALSDMSANTDVTVSSVTFGVSENENSTLLVANVIMDLSSIVFYNESIEIISDAYLKSRDTETQYEKLKFTSHVAGETKSGSINLKIPKSELGLENIKEILALNHDLKGLALQNDEKDAKFIGEASFSGVACEISDDGESSISNIKFSTPLTVEVNLSCQMPENSKLCAKIYPAGCEWELDADNLSIKLWYTVAYSLGKEGVENYVSSCEIIGDTEYGKSLSTVSVYYPEENETLFDVAKKFHTTVGDIAADNMIAEPTALGIPTKLGCKRLIIR